MSLCSPGGTVSASQAFKDEEDDDADNGMDDNMDADGVSDLLAMTGGEETTIDQSQDALSGAEEDEAGSQDDDANGDANGNHEDDVKEEPPAPVEVPPPKKTKSKRGKRGADDAAKAPVKRARRR